MAYGTKPMTHRPWRTWSVLVALFGLHLFGSTVADATSIRDQASTAGSTQRATPADQSSETVRMKHPPKGYEMVIAYFEPYYAEDNMDVRVAIARAAKVANENHFSLVVTCHGEDATRSQRAISPAELASQRLATIRDGLAELGVTQDRIKTAWGDRGAEAASKKLQGTMLMDHPTCALESAVEASR